MFWFDASRSINVSGLFTTFSHNDVFHIQNNTKNVKILSWHSDATKNANRHDIVTSLSNVRNIDIYSPILENSSLVERVLDVYDDGGSNPGAVRQMLTDNSTLSGSKLVSAYSVATDSNYLIPMAGTVTQLSAITAGRTLTLPSATVNFGKVLTIVNRNTAAYSWNIASPYYRNVDGTNITTVPSNTTQVLVSDGAVWRLISSAQMIIQPTYTTNLNNGAPPTKAQLNSAYGAQKAGSTVTY